MIPSMMTRLQIAQAIETLQTVQKTNSPKSREWQAASPILHSLYAEMAKREPRQTLASLTIFGTRFDQILFGVHDRALVAFGDDDSRIIIQNRSGDDLPTATNWTLACYDADGECLHFFSNGGGPMVRSALESAQ